MTGDANNQPAITPWTDRALAEQQESLWQRVAARYT